MNFARIALAVLLLSGCTARQAYDSAQGWEQNRCKAIADKADYDRCMASAGPPYDAYKRQRESERK